MQLKALKSLIVATFLLFFLLGCFLTFPQIIRAACEQDIDCGSFSSSDTIIDIDCSLQQNQNTLKCQAGKVINIPVGGNNVPWIISGYNDGDYSMVMAMTNICTLPGNPAGCVNSAGSPSATGTVWNLTAGTTTSNNNCTQGTGGACNYFTQMTNIWNTLGDSSGNIAGQPKVGVVRNTTWNMDGFNSNGVRSANFNTPVTRQVNLPSYFDWQTGMDGGSGDSNIFPTNPAVNSLGQRFCHARYNTTNCTGANVGATYQYPWLRSAFSDFTARTWLLRGDSGISLDNNYTSNTHGLLPVFWLSSDITFHCGLGTYNNPYELSVEDCNTPPTLTLTTPTGNPWTNAATLTASGTVTDPDSGQIINIQYLNAGNVWTNFTSVNSPALNTSYTGTISIAGLAEGQHSLYVRACDGIACGNSVSANFQIDRTAPISAISVTGGTFQSDGVTYENTPAITLTGADVEGSAGSSAVSGLASIKHVWLTGDGTGITTIVGGNANGISVGFSSGYDGQPSSANANCNMALPLVEFFTSTISPTPSFPIPDEGQFTLCAQSTDNAGNVSVVARQTFILRSDDIIYTENFNTLVESAPSAASQFTQVIIVNEGQTFVLNGNLLSDTSSTPLQVCLKFAHVNPTTNPICTNVTSSTSPTAYTSNIPTSALPTTQDVFISTAMTTTDLITGNTHTQPIYFVLFVRRPISAINKVTRSNHYVRMSSGTLN